MGTNGLSEKRCAPRAVGAALLILACAGLAPPAAGAEIDLVEGVTHVRNPARPLEGRETLRLEELWRVGGEDEEGLLLGIVSEVCGDEAGNVYVMDAQLCQVHVFSPAGELVRTIFREGEGPGELLRPRDMFVDDEGVGVGEEFPAKIVKVNREGLPLDNLRIVDQAGGQVMYAMSTVSAGGGNLVAGIAEIRMTETPGIQDRRNALVALSPKGEVTTRYCETKTSYDYNDFKFREGVHAASFWWAHAVGGDGRVYAAADRDAYAVSVFRPDGDLERVIERDYETYERTPAEKERIQRLFDSAAASMPIDMEFIIEETEPAIDAFHRGLRVDGENQLWVTSSRGLRNQDEGVMLSYDVFDPEGRYARQVAVLCEGDPWYDTLFWITDDTVILVKGAMAALVAQFGGRSAVDSEGEEPTPQELICYRVAARS